MRSCVGLSFRSDSNGELIKDLNLNSYRMAHLYCLDLNLEYTT